jgi:hypothetical protein
MQTQLGLIVIGNISANTGLGVHARHLPTLILESSTPVISFNAIPNVEISFLDSDHASRGHRTES